MPETKPVSDPTAAPFVCRRNADGLGAVWIDVRGELDVLTAPRLGSSLNEAPGEAILVVLDLRGLTFLDSAGVHVIMDAAIRLRRAGGRFIVIRAPGHVDNTFTLLGVTGDIETLDLTPAEPAVQALLHVPVQPPSA